MQLCKGKDIHKRHGGVVKLLHKALFLVINRLFPEWDISSEKWKRVYRNDVSPRCQWGESGLYSVHYAYTFNGLDLTESLDMGYHNNRRAKLIWMLLAMWGNSGIVPPEFGQLMYPSA
ncbi:uncharacterized protein LOC124688352 [Lolium rigidum]|nr:uncharacterized protein LOC124688352 [Lolium rigidum]